MKKSLISSFMVLSALISSCDEDDGPKCKFTFQDETYTSNGGPCTEYGMDSAGEEDGLEWGLSISDNSIVLTTIENTFIYNSDPPSVDITKSGKTFTFTAHMIEIDIPSDNGTIEGTCTCTNQ